MNNVILAASSVSEGYRTPTTLWNKELFRLHCGIRSYLEN